MEQNKEEIVQEELKPNPEYILEVKNLKKYFPLNRNFFGKPQTYLRAVDNVSFGVKKGQTIGVVGESGCGKTTLGRTILKLYDSDGGKIWFDGKDLTEIKRNKMNDLRVDIQLVFQDPYSSLPPRMTVGSIISEAVKVHNIVPKEEVQSYTLKIMEQCGLQPSYYDRYPHEFSGGQRQRICIARALAVNPKLVICDEPVSALDVSIQAQVVNLMKDIQQETGTAYLFIAHDLSMVKYISDRIGVLHLGHLLETGTTEEIFENPIHPYTKSLLSAIPAPNPVVEKNRVALSYDYKTSGIDYNKGTDHLVSGTHYVKCTDEEFKKWTE